MEEKLEKMYQEFLKEKLDLIFKIDNSVTRLYKRKDGKYNIMDNNRNFLCEEWFDYDPVGDFQDGCIIVRNGILKYNIMDTKGKLMSEEWYDSMPKFINGFSVIEKNGKYNIIDTKGKLISEEWYDQIYEHDFKNGFAVVEKNNKYNIIDTNGKLLNDNWCEWNSVKNQKFPIYTISPYLVMINGKLMVYKTDMNNYQVKKHGFKYQCNNPITNDSYNVKYQPIKRYGIRYTICLNHKELFLYDRINNTYEILGNVENVRFDDNFIIDLNNKKVFFVYENQKIDITEYYNKYLYNNIDKISIRKGVRDILSKEEYVFLKSNQREQLMQEVKKEKEDLERAQKLQELEDNKIRFHDEQEIAQQEKKKAFEKIKEGFETLRKMNNGMDISNLLPLIRENVDIFITCGDHKEIDKDYIDILLLIDLTHFDFKNVKVDGINFQNTNVILGAHGLNPQEVYNKNISNCNFEGIYVPPFVDFTGVDIRGTRFSNDKNPVSLDFFNGTFKDAIWDESTTYNGKSFGEIFGEEKKVASF